jgi:hypothetical protein
MDKSTQTNRLATITVTPPVAHNALLGKCKGGIIDFVTNVATGGSNIDRNILLRIVEPPSPEIESFIHLLTQAQGDQLEKELHAFDTEAWELMQADLASRRDNRTTEITNR